MTTAHIRYHCLDRDKLAYVVKRVESSSLLNDVEHSGKKSNNRDHVLLLVLDVSGSMSGVLSDAKTAIIRLLKDNNFAMFQMYSSIHFITYHDKVEMATELNIETYESVIGSQTTHGCTNFTDALVHIQEYVDYRVTDNKGVDAQVCFVTDGCHNSGGDPNLQIAKMHNLYQTNTQISIAFHALGFTQYHDVNFLQKIIGIGNEQGSFQYAQNSDELNNCLNTLNALLADIGSSNTCYCKMPHETDFRRIRVGVPQIVDILDSDAYSILSSIKLKSEEDGSVVESVDIQIEGIEDLVEQLEMVFHCIELQLLQFAKNLESGIVLDVKDLARIDDSLTQLINTDSRFKRLKNKLDKTRVFERVKGMKDRVAALYTASKKIAKKERIAHHEFAQLMSASYDFITKSSLSKKLDKRVQQNLHLFEDIEKFKSNYQFEVLTSQEIISGIPVESLDTFKCSLSTMNWAELTRERNSIGFGIRMSRNQFIPAQYKLEQLSFDGITQEEVHGGFNSTASKAGSVIEGVSREHINGLIPLYINKDHWTIAKQDLKPLFGWMTTLDVFGYNPQQLQTLPLVVLANFLTLPKWSELHCILFLQLWRTCKVLKQEIFPDYSQLENRLPDKISSNMVLLAKVLVDPSTLIRWNMSLQEFIYSVLEEEVRRQSRHLSDDHLVDVLIPSMACTHLVQIRTDYSPSELYELLMKSNESESDQETFETYESIPHDPSKCDNMFRELLKRLGHSKLPIAYSRLAVLISMFFKEVDVEELVKDMDKNFGIPNSNLIQKLQSLMNGIQLLKETDDATKDLLQVLATSTDDQVSSVIESLVSPCLTPAQVQALVIQCFSHRIHGVRRQAVTDETVKNPFTESESIITDFVHKCKQQQISRINNICQQAYNFEHRYPKLNLEEFLNHAKDKIGGGELQWLQENKELLNGVKFFHVKTLGTKAVTSRRDILRVDEQDVLKELIFSYSKDGKAENPCVVVVTGSAKVDPSIVNSVFECTSAYFPDAITAEGLVPNMNIASVPVWLPCTHASLPLCIDKNIMKNCQVGVYGASGVSDVLAFIPKDVLNNLIIHKRGKHGKEQAKLRVMKRYQ